MIKRFIVFLFIVSESTAVFGHDYPTEENLPYYGETTRKPVKHPQTILYEFDGYGRDMPAPALPPVIIYVKENTKNMRKN